jgi:hypothetical protein
MSPSEIDAILAFLGYGNLDAHVWFIGIEERLGNANEREAWMNIKARGKFEKVMDLRKAHLSMRESGAFIDIERKASFTQVWIWMAKIMRAIAGENNWRNLDLAKEYVRYSLGREEGDTFLAEFSPIPKKKKADKAWLNWFEHRCPELDKKLLQRRQNLQGLMQERNPPLVICYGKFSDAAIAGIFNQQTKWQHEGKISWLHDPRRLLLPFFGNGQIGHEIVTQLVQRDLLATPIRKLLTPTK